MCFPVYINCFVFSSSSFCFSLCCWFSLVVCLLFVCLVVVCYVYINVYVYVTIYIYVRFFPSHPRSPYLPVSRVVSLHLNLNTQTHTHTHTHNRTHTVSPHNNFTHTHFLSRTQKSWFNWHSAMRTQWSPSPGIQCSPTEGEWGEPSVLTTIKYEVQRRNISQLHTHSLPFPYSTIYIVE